MATSEADDGTDPVDSAELVERLREADVPEAFYDIPGVHDVPIQLDAYYFLCREADGWTVGLRQRSQDSVIRRFATETEACAYLYDTLIQLSSPPSGPAQPLEELLADTEEIQRQAWEDFDRRRGAADDG
ncbi:hypothetical protein [Streptomyces broussonetiae]|uniref:hypothetical protein n=1 Tax=Streptomyces broussonetiae TaxID=2686304 RepID=UPI0035D62FD9